MLKMKYLGMKKGLKLDFKFKKQNSVPNKFSKISWWKMPVRTFSYTWVWKLVSRDGFSGLVFLAFVS